MIDDSKPSEYEQKLWNYIATLEATNDSLLETLKQCVKTMLKEVDYVSDPIEWRMVLEMLTDVIEETENYPGKRNFIEGFDHEC